MRKNIRPDNLIITKASGNTALFSPTQLISSLKKSGATEDVAEFILKSIEPQLYNGIPTKQIYRMAFALLKRQSKEMASKYKLKNAIFEMGPSGYPFELLVGEILKQQGYSVLNGQIIKGACVKHEIDVIATKDKQRFMIECKFHHRNGIFCDIKVPLYIKARFNDLVEEWKKNDGEKNNFNCGWVVTNTRFTTDALKYGNCVGLKMLSWDYPHKNALKNLVDQYKLYPITCLHSLSMAEKQKLFEIKIVLSRQLCRDGQILISAGVNPSRIKNIIAEANRLCGMGLEAMV